MPKFVDLTEANGLLATIGPQGYVAGVDKGAFPDPEKEFEPFEDVYASIMSGEFDPDAHEAGDDFDAKEYVERFGDDEFSY